MKLGFVCTNYNNSSYTRAAVASLHTDPDGEVPRVVVVDNASRSEDIADLKQVARDFPEVDLILSPENVGYFPGLNLGIDHIRARYPEIEHLVVGNNDLAFPSGFAREIREHGAILESWAVVAPDLIAPDGQHQNPHVLNPVGRFRREVWNIYYSSYVLARIIRLVAKLTRRVSARPENQLSSELHRAAGPIEQGYGACYLLGPAFFRHFPRLFAPTFLMQEEFFLGEQLRAIGQLTYYDPRFVVHHAGHATMSKVPSRRHWELSRDAHRLYRSYRDLARAEQLQVLSGERSLPNHGTSTRSSRV